MFCYLVELKIDTHQVTNSSETTETDNMLMIQDRNYPFASTDAAALTKILQQFVFLLCQQKQLAAHSILWKVNCILIKLQHAGKCNLFAFPYIISVYVSKYFLTPDFGTFVVDHSAA